MKNIKYTVLKEVIPDKTIEDYVVAYPVSLMKSHQIISYHVSLQWIDSSCKNTVLQLQGSPSGTPGRFHKSEFKLRE